MLVQLPFFNESQFEYDIELNSELFKLSFIYNSSFDNWVMSILSSRGELILAGIRLTLNTPLLRERTNLSLPKGYFIVVTESQIERITYESMVLSETSLVFVEE